MKACLWPSSLRRVDPDSGVVERGSTCQRISSARDWRESAAACFNSPGRQAALVWKPGDPAQGRGDFLPGRGVGPVFRRSSSDHERRQRHARVARSDSFARVGEIVVRRAGRPVRNLNELECVEGVVYANVWQDNSHRAHRSAHRRGDGWIDASGLLAPEEAGAADVLNGIGIFACHRAFRGHRQAVAAGFRGGSLCRMRRRS